MIWGAAAGGRRRGGGGGDISLEQIFDRFEEDVLEEKLFGHLRLSKDRGGNTGPKVWAV